MMHPPSGRRFDLLAMGRSCIDLYAHEVGVPITEVRSFDAYVGGCPTNVSVGTRRLGLRSALLTGVGADQVADFVLSFLNREGVETRFIARKPGRRTSAVILTIEPPDRFPLTFYRDGCADRELTIDDVVNANVADAAIVFLTGTGLSHEPGRSATFAAAEQARASGALVCVDLDYRPDQWHDTRAFGLAMRALLRSAHLAIGTEEEVRAAGGIDGTADAATRLVESGVDALVLKRGAEGAVVHRPNSAATAVPPFRVDILNVLGAGDAFASGVVYGLIQGWPLERAVEFGNATGAIVVTRHGCANFMPTLDEVHAFVASKGGWSWAKQSA